MNVKIKLVHPDARLPEYKSTWAAGADIFAVEDVIIQAGQRVTVSAGFALELPRGYEAQVRGRSGLFRDEGILVNVGTVDSDYRGLVGVMLANLNAPIHTHLGRWSTDFYAIAKGERIAQLVIGPVMRATWEVTDELSETVRGAGGFGHSGRF